MVKWTDDQLKHLETMIVNQYNMAQITREFRVSRSAINNAIMKFGLPRPVKGRTVWTTDRVNQVIEMSQKQNNRDLARHFDTTPGRIANVLYRNTAVRATDKYFKFRKFSIKVVRDVYRRIEAHEPVASIAKRHGMSRMYVYIIKNNETLRAISTGE